jgi:DNA-binding NarL/FixJ family response regulator
MRNRLMLKEDITTITRRELDVIHLLGCGYTNREVAKKLSISERTVQAHIYKLSKNLKIKASDKAMGIVIMSIADNILNIKDLVEKITSEASLQNPELKADEK